MVSPATVSRRPLRAGGLTLWVEQQGSGTPLLLIAGLGYASWCWAELRQALSDRYRVIAFDNRGAGRSDKPAGPYSIEMLADDAAAVLTGLGVDSAHVLGHSMGGYIALTLALRQPQRVRSLILVGTSPGGPDTAPVPEETMNAWKQAGSLSPADYARRSMPNSFAPGWTKRNAERFEQILRQRLEYPTPPQSWLAQYQACADYVLRGVDVARIDKPALVIHGKQDRVVPHANGERLAQRLPRARFVSLDNVGHLPYFEDARFAERVREHLMRQQAHS